MSSFHTTIPGLLPSTKYLARVRAVNAFNVKSDWSDAVVFSTPTVDSGSQPASNFNIINFGAVGDGIHDDTTAIQDAADAAEAAGGGVVYAPAGRYKVTGQIFFRSNVDLMGAGRGSPTSQYEGTKFILTTANASLVFGDYIYTSTNFTENPNVSAKGSYTGHFGVDATATATVPIYIGLVSDRTFTSITSYNSAGVGFRLHACQNNMFMQLRSHTSASHAFEFDFGFAGNTIMSSTCHRPGGAGIALLQTNGTTAVPSASPRILNNTFIDCLFERMKSTSPAVALIESHDLIKFIGTNFVVALTDTDESSSTGIPCIKINTPPDTSSGWVVLTDCRLYGASGSPKKHWGIQTEGSYCQVAVVGFASFYNLDAVAYSTSTSTTYHKIVLDAQLELTNTSNVAKSGSAANFTSTTLVTASSGGSSESIGSITLGADTMGDYVASVSSSGTGISVSGSGGEGAAVVVASNATSANTASTIVARDASGNFSAGTITAALSGNASTATTAAAWTTARTFSLSGDVTGSVSVKGDGDVTLAATIAANSVALGTDTTGNYIATIATSGTGLSVSGSGSETAAVTITSNATSDNTASTIVARDISGNFTAGTITAALTGNASTASTWLTSRTITLGGDLTGSVSLNGSADVTLTATVAANAVALGTDTTGNYVATITGTTDQVTVTGSGSETAAITLALPQSIATTSSPSFTGLTLSGDLAVNGADITTTATGTATLFNTNATTVNLAGAATAVSIGAATGTTTVNNALTVAGNLTVNGTTITVNSTTMTVDDPIITLGGDTAPAADDNKDRGIEFRYHTGAAAKLGFFGYDDSTGKFAFLTDATNTSEVFSGTKATLDANLAASDLTGTTLASSVVSSSLTSVGTLTSLTVGGKITTVAPTTSTASILLTSGSADPSSPATGDLWNNAGTLKFRQASATKTIAYTDSNITGSADSAYAPAVVTSTTRPSSSLAEGDFIYETDHDALRIYDGSAWKYAGGRLGANLILTAENLASGSTAWCELTNTDPVWDPLSGLTTSNTTTFTGVSLSRSSNVVTATVGSTAAVRVGAKVTVTGASNSNFNSGNNATGTVISIPSTTTFTYSQTAANASATGATVVITNYDYYEFKEAGVYNIAVTGLSRVLYGVSPQLVFRPSPDDGDRSAYELFALGDGNSLTVNTTLGTDTARPVSGSVGPYLGTTSWIPYPVFTVYCAVGDRVHFKLKSMTNTTETQTATAYIRLTGNWI